ncbi:MAG: hypothetical protein GKS00_13300 [Alphaproteobacteria bacterium]|nr:hypothetical protein [Alphaproteobacteria bacterium]
MATYTGARTIDGIAVLADGAPLDPRTDLKRFTDRGFEWTYEGDEPAQLALALLAHHFNDDVKALSLCDVFMRRVVANLDNDWELNGTQIDSAVAELDGGSNP